jgi:putative oxidoreductase
VLFLVLSGCAIGALGGGRFSLDHAFGLQLDGWLSGGKGLAVAALGAVGALVLLAVCWRPPPRPATT